MTNAPAGARGRASRGGDPAGNGLIPPRPTRHVIHTSLVRPVLFAGAEPAAVAVEVSVAFALVFVVGFHLATVLLAAFYLTAVHALMVWVATQDAQMSALYVRSLSARDYYAPHAAVHGRRPVLRPSIPPRR